MSLEFAMIFGLDTLNVKKNAKSLRAAGDRARDRGDWGEAVEKYSEYLRTENEDFPIWVQLGHAYKEQRLYDQAEIAYEKSRSLNPEDADTYLQLGHLLKIMGRTDAALNAYLESYKLDPTFAAESEIKALQPAGADLVADTPFKTIEANNVIYVEIDDMLIYLEAHSTVSGIQRVQAEFARYLIEKGCEINGTQYIFVINPPYQDCIWALNPDAVHAVVTYATGSQVDHKMLQQRVATVRSMATRVKPSTGQCYLVLGAFWVFNTVSGRFLHLKRAGLRIGGYIHDLIPINQPEYCDEGLCHEFLLSFGDSMQVFDFILTNSHNTADEVIKYRKRLGLPSMPVEAVQLAHANKMSTDVNDTWTPKIRQLQGKKFAMMVSTIEARKNHRYLVDIWRNFYNEGLEPPELVFVGRFGWRVHDLMNTLKQSKNFGGKLHILHGLTDAELNKLYKECAFTVFPSYVEGWGLPVGESLAHGKPCVASSTSAIPEIGGDFVDYVDPWNMRGGIEVFRKICFDDKYLASRTKNIQQNFKIRTWSDFSENLADAAVKYHKAKIEPRISQANFKAGVVFRPNALAPGMDLPKDYAVNPVRLLLSASWGAVENWGSWLLGNHSEIEFHTPYKEGDDIVAYIEYFGAPFVGDDGRVTALIGPAQDNIAIDPAQKWAKIVPDGVFVVKVEGKVGSGGIVNIHTYVDGEIKLENDKPGARRFSIGIQAIAYALKTDVVSRSDITEELISRIASV
jgi:glycosyltransferase involved in cell wall biosynthesis